MRKTQPGREDSQSSDDTSNTLPTLNAMPPVGYRGGVRQLFARPASHDTKPNNPSTANAAPGTGTQPGLIGSGGVSRASLFDVIDLTARHVMNLIPIILGLHVMMMVGGWAGLASLPVAATTIAGLPWILAVVFVALGIVGYTTIFHRATMAGLRVLLLIATTWALCLWQGGNSVFASYLLVLVVVYPIFLHQRYGLAIPWVAAAAFLSLSISTGPGLSVMGVSMGWYAGLLVVIGHVACGLGYASQHFRRLHKLAHTDELTGLSNRRHFRESIDKELELVRRDGRPLTLITYDLDRFKQINDEHGHMGGDIVLRHFADLLRINTRRNDVVARIGGDEFAVVLPDMNAESAETYVQSILDTLSLEQISVPGGKIQLSASAGVVTADRKGPFDIDELMRRSDENLYRSKRSRRRFDADSERLKRSLLLRPRSGKAPRPEHTSLSA